MPRVPVPSLPLSGLFAIAKPSGPTSMSVINDIKKLMSGSRLFADPEKLKDRGGKRGRRAKDAVKVGQGGTLDPLADGVLVVGVGRGTKNLSEFLDCVKEYQTTCLLGCETDTYDSEGAQVRLAPWRHVTRELVESKLDNLRGEIEQVPPIFSALKMNGMPLYEYARNGIPLPRQIEKRKVTVHSLELAEWKSGDHQFRWPDRQVSEEDKNAREKLLQDIEGIPSTESEQQRLELAAEEAPTAFVLKMRVSGGTYVRSIVHDLGRMLGSAGHVVTLTRSRQGRFTVDPVEESDRSCVPWEVFSKALENVGQADEEGLLEWERSIIDNIEIVEGKK